MNAKPARWQDLPDDDLISVARLAEAGRQDQYDNGRRHSNPDYALTETAAKEYDSGDIWRDACGHGGHHSERFGAWACGECGCVHIGIEDAAQCCYEDRFDEDDDDDEEDD